MDTPTNTLVIGDVTVVTQDIDGIAHVLTLTTSTGSTVLFSDIEPEGDKPDFILPISAVLTNNTIHTSHSTCYSFSLMLDIPESVSILLRDYFEHYTSCYLLEEGSLDNKDTDDSRELYLYKHITSGLIRKFSRSRHAREVLLGHFKF